MIFDSFFTSATGHSPYPYQRRVALDGQMPALIIIPTGLGKTAAVRVKQTIRDERSSYYFE